MKLLRLITTVTLLLASSQIVAQSQIHSVRMWPAPDNTRLVFDISSPVKYTLYTLKNPDRIVIDINDARLTQELTGLDYSKSLLEGIRTAKKEGHNLRVVLDLKGKVRPKSFMLKPNKEYGHRLVIDLYDMDKKPVPVRSVNEQTQNARDVVIAIDAGHGGDDPGAIGPKRTKEKDVVLAIARRLNTLVKKEHGMRPVMIRDGDYYIGLRKRTEKAHHYKADLFVSIHADSFPDPRAKGSSVYILSRRGASSEQARLLAEKENSADLIGGVSLDDKDDLLASVLLDLSQTATAEASIDVASQVLKRLKNVNKLHKRRVEQAGFRVLKSPDIPSILVETAFISNPNEERMLRSFKHQQKMASAIMGGLDAYFRENPPPGTLLAKNRASSRKHVVSRGDTLSDIARQYRVSLRSLRSLNNIKGSHLREGDVLTIPTEG